MLNYLPYILIFVVLIFCGIIIYFVFRKLKEIENSKNNDQSLQLINQNLNSFSERINVTNQAINERLDNAARVISAVNRELGTMSQIGSQLSNFQEFLKSPKLRGGLGEQGLKDMLAQSLPHDLYKMQYSFRSGQIVDAIIKIEAGLIPIDAKFPLENFNRFLNAKSAEEKTDAKNKFRSDFRVHVNAISKKYINPDEGTVDFAFMYLPSESVFFEVVNSERDLFDYAAKNKIIPSSPSTFFYYLRTIMLGLEGKRITEMSREIMKTLKSIKQESHKFGDNLGKLNRHLSNAKSTMDTVNSGYASLAEKIDHVDVLESDQTKLLEDDTNEKIL